MKKSSKNNWKILFWLVCVAGFLALTFLPPERANKNPAVTVKVQQQKPIVSQQKSGGEEQAPVSASPSGVTVPVMPEKTEPLPPGSHPKIAIVIDDVGVDIKDSDKAIKLPPAVTLSFLPYAPRLREQAAAAHAAGHELILHMPMEPIGREDPGPGALLVGLPIPELQERFATALASFIGFDGVNNHMGSKFTTYQDGMNMVMDELQQRHLFFLDSKTSAQSIGLKAAQEKHVPTLARDVFLDDDQAPDAIRQQLSATERVARRKNYAVAIGHPHTTTMEVLAEWIKDAQARGFELIPLHDLVTGK